MNFNIPNCINRQNCPKGYHAYGYFHNCEQSAMGHNPILNECFIAGKFKVICTIDNLEVDQRYIRFSEGSLEIWDHSYEQWKEANPKYYKVCPICDN